MRFQLYGVIGLVRSEYQLINNSKILQSFFDTGSQLLQFIV